ncbi:acyl-CoA dehydrogenase family protein [Nocardioides halotolerans]|uniref:acyl-CoA dehydrogenase family protein n=1 Tax=Nocardioides halotolerans TaxID=433660 RepID=UPI00040AD22E|nr:acyl-CoA dehydrogenase family protein [Nocardioides halotolerans]
MHFELTDAQRAIQDSVGKICNRFSEDYWAGLDDVRAYPDEFVKALTDEGWLGLMIPEEYGGGGGTVSDAALVLEAITRHGAVAASAHAQMYTMGTLLRHGSTDQKARYLPRLASGELRLQAFGLTEPEAGSDTLSMRTTAVRDGDHYVINGGKIFTSRFQHSDVMMLIARTTPQEQAQHRTHGLSVFLVDLAEAGDAISVRPIKTMVNHETNQLFFDDLRVPANNLIGQEGEGFTYLLSGLNVERILVASECIGAGLWFVDRSARYAGERVVFGRAIGANQGVQFPIAQAFAQLEAASLMRWQAAAMFEAGHTKGYEANTAKLLASQASWAAANAAMDTFGGYGFAEEYGIERRFREARLFMVAPVSNNLVLAHIGQHVLGMPRTF